MELNCEIRNYAVENESQRIRALRVIGHGVNSKLETYKTDELRVRASIKSRDSVPDCPGWPSCALTEREIARRPHCTTYNQNGHQSSVLLHRVSNLVPQTCSVLTAFPTFESAQIIPKRVSLSTTRCARCADSNKHTRSSTYFGPHSLSPLHGPTQLGPHYRRSAYANNCGYL